MTLFRGTVVDTTGDDLAGCALRVDEDAGVLVRAGAIVARGPYATIRAAEPDEPVVVLADGLLLPGFVDTHVHFPQTRVIGGLGLRLLEWLDTYALPEELRFADPAYAAAVAAEFVDSLLAAGTTTALVFGAHFPDAVDALFEAAERRGVRLVGGLVVGNRGLPPGLLITPQAAYDDGLALARRWHGRGRLRYAVTPRFSLACDEAMLAACGALLRAVDGAYATSHLNENDEEIAAVDRLFAVDDYLATYAAHGLVGPRSVFAHDVHPRPRELAALAAAGAVVAHCPTSNAALGSGLFPLRAHVDAGVRIALGTDVGAGTGFSLLKEGLQAYLHQHLLGADGYPLTSTMLLYLASLAGARALGMAGEVGGLGAGQRFDAQWIHPRGNPVLERCLHNVDSAQEALARVFTLAGAADVAAVWVDGELVHGATG